MITSYTSDQDGSAIHLLPDQAGGGIPLTLASPITAFFSPLPPDRVSSGYLELGEWQGDACRQEFNVELYLALDGKVWAEVGPLSEIPLRPLEDREEEVQAILHEFLDAYAEWAEGRKRTRPAIKTLRAWPSSQLTAWLDEASKDAPAEMRRLMHGVMSEIRALGFRVEPAGGAAGLKEGARS